MTITALPRRSECDADLSARFTCAVLPFRDVLHRGARRLTKSEADAEDLLQDTLLRAYTGFHNFQEGTNLQAWLFKILYNKWASGYRARQCRPVEVAEDALTDRVLAGAAYAFGLVSVEAKLFSTIPDADIAAALASLPDGFTEVLYLSIVEGYTYAETAEILDVPVGTVMSRVHRGRQRLRVALAHRAPKGYADDPTAQHVA
jgi:RNA polymerase sigma-70 factor (ECF subfamily)